MSVVSNNILAGASGQGGASSGYEIKRSLRFNSGDTATLSKSISSAGNRKTWTFSFWVKLLGGGTYSTNHILDGGLSSIGGSGGQSGFEIEFTDTGALRISDQVNNSTSWSVQSTALFRDYSAWYHVVVAHDTTQITASNRVKIYVNGVQLNSFATANYPVTNSESGMNKATTNRFGASDDQGSPYLPSDFLLADVHFIDGQGLDSSSFGEFDDNNVWQPKEYSGTYGTNGFHLDFSDNSTTAALGTDTSGNGNSYSLNNFSITAGVGNDSLRDSPSQIAGQTDTGAGGEIIGNYPVLNVLHNDAALTISNGNLEISTSSASNWHNNGTTMAVQAGEKSYCEVTILSGSAPGNGAIVELGVKTINSSIPLGDYLGKTTESWQWQNNGGSGVLGHNNSYSGYASGATYVTNDVIGIAVDLNSGTLKFYKNGTDLGTAFTNLPTDKGVEFACALYGSSKVAWNFGQRPFTYQNAGTNRPSSDFKCLCSANLSTPTIADGSKYFDTKLYTGTGSDQSLTGLAFQSDFVWIKTRNESENHFIVDSVRGVTKQLYASSTATESTNANRFKSFDSNGFTVGTTDDTNQSGNSFVAWAWDGGTSTVSNTDGSITSQVRANPSAGFSVVTYTVGNSTAQTVGHGLNGATPKLIIVKETNQANNWQVYHSSLGNGYYTWLNSNNAAATNVLWNSTSPTGSVFSIYSGGSAQFYDGKDHVAYCFAPVEGYSAMGSCLPNGTADNIFVYTGFRPKFILARFTSAGDWMMLDTSRRPNGPTGGTLAANVANSEDGYYSNSQVGIDFLSNGFKVRHSGSPLGDSGKTVIYYAVAENPFNYSRAY